MSVPVPTSSPESPPRLRRPPRLTAYLRRLRHGTAVAFKHGGSIHRQIQDPSKLRVVHGESAITLEESKMPPYVVEDGRRGRRSMPVRDRYLGGVIAECDLDAISIPRTIQLDVPISRARL